MVKKTVVLFWKGRMEHGITVQDIILLKLKKKVEMDESKWELWMLAFAAFTCFSSPVDRTVVMKWPTLGVAKKDRKSVV